MTLTSIRLKEAWNWGGLSLRDLVMRTYRAIDQHDTLNHAAVVAFYAVLSLAPLLSLVLAFALGAQTGVAAQIKTLCKEFMPQEAYHMVRDQINKIQTSSHVGLVSLSILILLWSASSLFVAIMDATNAAYGVRDERPWWKRRLIAIVLTVVETILLMGACLTIALWPQVMGWLGLGTLATTLATVVQWLVVIIALLAAFALAYYFGPHIEQQWEWITPGSALGVLVLIAASLGFQFYLRFGDTYSETYGVLAGVVLMMLWMYIAALALLVGAEVNCVIEHAAPHGRARGQKKLPIINRGPPSLYKTQQTARVTSEKPQETITDMEPYQIVVLTVAALVVAKLLVVLVITKGRLGNYGLACKAAYRILSDAATAERIRPLLEPPAVETTKPAQLSPEPLRLLTLLQREGRLLDFLLEDIQGAADEQVGAGVRELHRKAQAVIKEHLVLEPVLAKNEGETVEVQPSFDPSAIRLIGNVTGQPPFRGVLQHHGWRVKNYTLPTLPEGQDQFVLAPAEVELP